MTAYEYNAIDVIIDKIFDNNDIKNTNHIINKAIQDDEFEDQKVIDELNKIVSDFTDGLLNNERLEKRLIEIRDEIVNCDCEQCLENKKEEQEGIKN